MRYKSSISKSITESLLEGYNLREDVVGTIKSTGKGFYVGDPCYALADEDYYNIWGDENNFANGLIHLSTGDMLVHGTAYGDGDYPSAEGHFPVDSGTLCIMDASLVKKNIEGLGKIIPGEEASLVVHDGTFDISIKNPNNTFDIVTAYEEEEEDDYWEEEEEDDSYEEEMEESVSTKKKALKESTDNEEWKQVCETFCKKIGATLLFVNDDNFGYEDKNGKMIHMYADELESYLKNNKLDESATEEYWDAREICRDGFACLLKFNFGTDANGNNYIITIDNNEAERLRANSDEEAIEIYNKWKEQKDSGLVDYDFNNHYEKIGESEEVKRDLAIEPGSEEEEQLDSLYNENLAPFSLAEDFYDYTSTISITEDEWFDNIEAEHPETKEYTYNQMRHFAIKLLMKDLKQNPKSIETQLINDYEAYGEDSPEFNDIKAMYKKLKDNGININIEPLEKATKDMITESEEPRGLIVCTNCLKAIESKEGPQKYTKDIPNEAVWYSGADEEDYFTCEWCGDDFPVDEGVFILPEPMNESFEGNFEGNDVKLDLKNDETNPVWIVGDVQINGDTYRVNAKVFQEGSEFGIDKGPVSKLWVSDSNGNTIINYDRGWDIKPTEENQEVYNIILGAVRSFRNNNLYESYDDSEENEYAGPNYKVDTSNLFLTNYGWHNNSDIVYGRVALLPNDKGSKLMPGHYDIIYFCETGDLFIFKLGTDVRTAVNYLYNYGSDDYDWVKWDGRRIQLDNIYDVLNDDKLKDVPQEQRDAIERAVNNAYYNEEPFPLNKVNYD